ncbi:hypothetical protein PAESOLCIP111_01623 [Paenibacillus solanacearum]|uniref:Uncharacterized protein n=1 Tax=Paenibacillus solanacearum TaxID=2048548 RepID=A0A916NI22_9BACL|nr:hypothetical protein PAESOLCIP111_01623 [Paenibacillus solanacearum]
MSISKYVCASIERVRSPGSARNIRLLLNVDTPRVSVHSNAAPLRYTILRRVLTVVLRFLYAALQAILNRNTCLSINLQKSAFKTKPADSQACMHFVLLYAYAFGRNWFLGQQHAVKEGDCHNVLLDGGTIFDYISNNQTQPNRFGFKLLSRAGRGTSPMTPGNRQNFAPLRRRAMHGANSCGSVCF